VPSGNEEASDDYDPCKNGHSSTLSPRPRVLPLAEEVGGSTSVPVRVPELKRGVLERGLPSYTYSNWTEQLFCLTPSLIRALGAGHKPIG